MATMCCAGCNGGFTLGGRDHVIDDDKGRKWTFEMHPWCGPIVLRRDGNPKTRQPGSRSPFWAAFNRSDAARVDIESLPGLVRLTEQLGRWPRSEET